MMNATTQYLDIEVLDAAERQHLQERLLAALHDFNSADRPRLAVTFPDWQDAVVEDGRLLRPGNPGLRMRFFGHESDLLALERSLFVDIAVGVGDLATSGVQSLPARHTWVRFVRDRSYEKSANPSALRRRARRAGVPVSELPQDKDNKGAPPHHCFSYTSQTNGQSFALRVRRAAAETTPAQWTGELNTFGFCGSEGAVPAF